MYRVYVEFADGRERQCWFITDDALESARFAIRMAAQVTNEVSAVYDEEK